MIILDSNGKRIYRTIVFDVETTGLSPEYGDRILEIGAVVLEGGTFVDEFHSLINANRSTSITLIMYTSLFKRLDLIWHLPRDCQLPVCHQVIFMDFNPSLN